MTTICAFLPLRGARRHFSLDLDQFDEAVDAVIGEVHDALGAGAPRIQIMPCSGHFDSEVEEEVDVFAEVLGDQVDGPDVGDLFDCIGQAAPPVTRILPSRSPA